MALADQYDKIYTFCYFKVRHKEVAEDITQETFLRYLQSYAGLDSSKQLAYLYTIAKNGCADYFRRASHVAPLTEDLIAPLPDTDTALAVSQAVSQLSEPEQELVLLRYTNELSLGEIASYLGCSRFALYRRMSKLEHKLKTLLPKEDFHG